jgi:Right handed beta helix region
MPREQLPSTEKKDLNMLFPKSTLLSLAFLAAIASPLAHAVQRTHVSAAFGNDANTATNCSAAAPCRFFQAAMTVTDNNGEVIVLDSGGYGAVTITKSLALIAPTGVYAGISVFPGANGVTISTPGINVVLSGLTINGQGGNDGINMAAGNSLTVENCVISNLTQNGINVNTAATVRVTDTVVRDNGSSGINILNGAGAAITRAVVSGNLGAGIAVQGRVANTATSADVADSTIDGNGQGVTAFSDVATATVKTSVRDSRALRSGANGLAAVSSVGALVSLAASNNIVSNNANGIVAIGAGGRVLANGNTVSDNNSFGLRNVGAIFESAANNLVRNNSRNIDGSITAVATN